MRLLIWLALIVLVILALRKKALAQFHAAQKTPLLPQRRILSLNRRLRLWCAVNIAKSISQFPSRYNAEHLLIVPSRMPMRTALDLLWQIYRVNFLQPHFGAHYKL